MQQAPDLDTVARARKLLAEGWGTNIAVGSVTRKRDQKSGLVDDPVWEAMKYLQAAVGWVRTEPQAISPSDTWGSQAE